MAKFHGGGHYLFKKDLKYYLLACGLVVLPLILFWIFFKFFSLNVSKGVIIAVLLLLVALTQLADPFIKLFRRKSNQYFRGGSGERDIKRELQKLPDDYTIFQDVYIGKDKGNLDFVVVGPQGVFLVEVKSHGGAIAYDGYNLTRNGKNFIDKNFFRQVHGQTWALKNYLKGQTGREIYIHSVLVFSNKYATLNFGYQPVNNIYIIQKDFLLGLFRQFPAYRYPAGQSVVEQALAKAV